MGQRITSSPSVFGGKPVLRGLRISVEMVLDLLSQGMSQTEILAKYPALEAEDIAASLRYAKNLVACEETELALSEGPQ